MATAENEPVTCNQSISSFIDDCLIFAIAQATIRIFIEMDMDMTQKLLLSEKTHTVHIYKQHIYYNNNHKKHRTEKGHLKHSNKSK